MTEIGETQVQILLQLLVYCLKKDVLTSAKFKKRSHRQDRKLYSTVGSGMYKKIVCYFSEVLRCWMIKKYPIEFFFLWRVIGKVFVLLQLSY